MAVSPDGRSLAAGTQVSDWGGVEVWDLTTGRLRWATAGNDGGIGAVVYSPDGRQLASGSMEGVLSLRDANSGKRRRRLARRGLEISSLAFSPDGRRLASAGGDPLEDEVAELRLWDLPTSRLLRSRRATGDFLNLAAFLSPNGPLPPRTHEGIGTLRLWDAEPGGRRRLVVGYDPAESQLAPDHTTFADAGDGRSVEIVDARTLQPRRTLYPRMSVAQAVAFSPDGSTLAVASSAIQHGALELWNPQTGKLQRTINLRGARVNVMTYLPDGRRLMIAEEQGPVRLWDLREGRLLATLQLFTWGRRGVNAPEWIAFTPEGYYDGSPGVEHFIRWRLGKQLFAGERYARVFRRPDLVRRAMRAETPAGGSQ